MRTTNVKSKEGKPLIKACQCGSETWRFARVTESTPWPWKDSNRTGYKYWPWTSGLLVICIACERTWFGNTGIFVEYERIVRYMGDGVATLTLIRGNLYPVKQKADTRVVSRKRGSGSNGVSQAPAS